ncbi:uncharacterized protein [Myotis yumanensis]|uniref:uncharacterized protein n=1 Tax=Myotis yumanensis TaxID=159337 RepID=UPI0038D45B0F
MRKDPSSAKPALGSSGPGSGGLREFQTDWSGQIPDLLCERKRSLPRTMSELDDSAPIFTGGHGRMLCGQLKTAVLRLKACRIIRQKRPSLPRGGCPSGCYVEEQHAFSRRQEESKDKEKRKGSATTSPSSQVRGLQRAHEDIWLRLGATQAKGTSWSLDGKVPTPNSVVLTTPTALKIDGVATWVHHTHVRSADPSMIRKDFVTTWSVDREQRNLLKLKLWCARPA